MDDEQVAPARREGVDSVDDAFEVSILLPVVVSGRAVWRRGSGQRAAWAASTAALGFSPCADVAI
jgi:hypothetical protein